MNPLETLITEYLSGLAGAYFARQLAVIVCIFVFGAIITDIVPGNKDSRIMRIVLAFPAGLSAFVITAYFMLVTGIPYNTFTVTAAVILECAAIISVGRKSFAAHFRDGAGTIRLVAAGVVIIVAVAASSGLAPVSISNDSMYFFRRYPDIIVYFGKLRDQFDFWLTDTGLGCVAIDTLPSLFGFEESFGIREFFHIDFLAFFAITVYERAGMHMPKKNARIASAVITLVLALSTPFIVLGHWALANMYFMEMFFIAAYTAIKRNRDGIGPVPLFLVALSLFRIEGTLFAVWLVLCISLYTDMGKKLATYVMIPMTLLFGGYCIRLFVGFYVLDNIYLFLTPQKAVLLVLVMIAAGIYMAFVEPVFKRKAGRMLPYVYIGGLAGVNLLLFLSDRMLYAGNLKAFFSNLFGQSGWGMLPHFMIAALLLVAAESVIVKIRGDKRTVRSDGFNTVLTVGFLLIVIAASFGRGDVLSVNVGDSGNRVLLQIVPLAVLTVSEMMCRLAGKEDEE